MVKKWILYIIFAFGILFLMVFLNAITPDVITSENNLMRIGIGNYIMKIIGELTIFSWLFYMIFNKDKF